jgi:hypothetical protein
MAGKTYAQLGTSADVQDADLIATYRSTGPLKTVTGTVLVTYLKTSGALGAYFLQASNNLSDLVSAATARTNLGLGSAALLASAAVLHTANNLSDVASVPTSRANLNANIALTYLHLRNQTNSGVNNGESFTAGGTWQTRTLNTSATNTISGASLAANQVTLPAGTYECELTHAPIAQQGGTSLAIQHRLRNITDSSTTLASGQGYTAVSGASQSVPMRGQFTLAGAKVLELQIAPNGSGGPTVQFAPAQALGEVIAWTDLYIRKIA